MHLLRAAQAPDQELFEMEAVDLTVAEEALGAVARKAIDRKTGRAGCVP